MVGGDLAAFGEAAVPHLPDQAARPLAIHRIDEYPVAYSPIVHSLADFHDLASEIQTHDARHGDLDAGHAAAGEDVVVVESGCPHRHHDFVGSGGGIGEIGIDLD